MDQAESSTPGRPLTYSGRNNPNKLFIITLFVDHISNKVFVEFQQTTSTAHTLKSMKNVEKEAYQAGIQIKSFHTDNGVFKSRAFRKHLEKNKQSISFCGVGAHHQNGVAERYIRTIIERSRTQLLHAQAHWKEKLDSELWTYSIRYLVRQWNNTPHKDLNLRTPNEVFSYVHETDHIKRASERLKQFHTFGCPVYVLKPKLQAGFKSTKWEPKSRIGIFLGLSNHHASNVAWVLNTTTNNISPQYHLVIDNKFSSVHRPENISQMNQWKVFHLSLIHI